MDVTDVNGRNVIKIYMVRGITKTRNVRQSGKRNQSILHVRS